MRTTKAAAALIILTVLCLCSAAFADAGVYTYGRAKDAFPLLESAEYQVYVNVSRNDVMEYCSVLQYEGYTMDGELLQEPYTAEVTGDGTAFTVTWSPDEYRLMIEFEAGSRLLRQPFRARDIRRLAEAYGLEKAYDLLYEQGYGRISVFLYQAVAVNADGTVRAFFINYPQDEILSWTDIRAVSAGMMHTVGLKKDGTVVCSNRPPEEDYGQCAVGAWTDVVAVSVSSGTSLGLLADGTVVAAGYNETGACNVGEWTDIVAVCAAPRHSVGLKADGTVVATGDNDDGQCDVRHWRNIVAIAASKYYTYGLQEDGTVVIAGTRSDSKEQWKTYNLKGDIVALYANVYNVFGLCLDGSVTGVGYDYYGAVTGAASWRNVTEMSAGFLVVAGIREDGTFVAAGRDDEGMVSAILSWEK